MIHNFLQSILALQMSAQNTMNENITPVRYYESTHDILLCLMLVWAIWPFWTLCPFIVSMPLFSPLPAATASQGQHKKEWVVVYTKNVCDGWWMRKHFIFIKKLFLCQIAWKNCNLQRKVIIPSFYSPGSTLQGSTLCISISIINFYNSTFLNFFRKNFYEGLSEPIWRFYFTVYIFMS